MILRINKGSSFSCLFLSRIVQFSRCRFCRFWKFLPRQATYLLYHIFGSLSSLFSNFFQNFFSILRLSHLLAAASLDQLASFSIIPHFKKFVKRFFRFFQIFFSCRSCGLSLRPALRLPSGLAANLFSIPHFRPFVKRFFKISFDAFLSTRFSKAFRQFNFPEDASLSDLSSSRSRLTALLLYHGFLKKSRLFYVKNAGYFFFDFMHISHLYNSA